MSRFERVPIQSSDQMFALVLQLLPPVAAVTNKRETTTSQREVTCTMGSDASVMVEIYSEGKQTNGFEVRSVRSRKRRCWVGGRELIASPRGAAR